MPASTLAAIATLEMVLLCKAFIALGGKIVVAVTQQLLALVF